MSQPRKLSVGTLISILTAFAALIVALLAWLAPFSPIGPSPFSPDGAEQTLPPELPTATEAVVENGVALNNPLSETNGVIWHAAFYGNKELKGPIILQGNIRGARNGLRVDWGVNAPSQEIPEDFFSAVLSATHNFIAGTYCFVLEVDDGARLFIDGEEVRSVWWGYTPGAVYKTKARLAEGPHDIQLHDYEQFERAAFHLYWYGGNEPVGPECSTVGHPAIQ